MRSSSLTSPPFIRGPSLIGQLDTIPLLDRKINGPVVMPISEKYKDLGTVVVGKLESGRIKKGDQLVMMPNKVRFIPLPIDPLSHSLSFR